MTGNSNDCMPSKAYFLPLLSNPTEANIHFTHKRVVVGTSCYVGLCLHNFSLSPTEWTERCQRDANSGALYLHHIHHTVLRIVPPKVLLSIKRQV